MKACAVVGGADDHRVEVLLLQALPPVNVGLRLGETSQGIREPGLVNVAQRDDVLVGQRFVMGQAAAPHADEGHVEFVARRVLAGAVRRLAGRAYSRRRSRQRRFAGILGVSWHDSPVSKAGPRTVLPRRQRRQLGTIVTRGCRGRERGVRSTQYTVVGIEEHHSLLITPYWVLGTPRPPAVDPPPRPRINYLT